MKFDVRMRLSGVNRMSEDGVHLSSVPSFLGDVSVEFEAARSRSNCGKSEVARCSIGVIRGVVQVIQNCFIGIPNLSRSLGLG